MLISRILLSVLLATTLTAVEELTLADGRHFKGTLADDGRTIQFVSDGMKGQLTLPRQAVVKVRRLIPQVPQGAEGKPSTTLAVAIAASEDQEYIINQDRIRGGLHELDLPPVCLPDQSPDPTQGQPSVYARSQELVKLQVKLDDLRKRYKAAVIAERTAEELRLKQEAELRRAKLQADEDAAKAEAAAKSKAEQEQRALEQAQARAALQNAKDLFARDRRAYALQHDANWSIVQQTQRMDQQQVILELDQENTYTSVGGDSMQGYVVRDLLGIPMMRAAVVRSRISVVFNPTTIAALSLGPVVAVISTVPNGAGPTITYGRALFPAP